MDRIIKPGRERIDCFVKVNKVKAYTNVKNQPRYPNVPADPMVRNMTWEMLSQYKPFNGDGTINEEKLKQAVTDYLRRHDIKDSVIRGGLIK